MSSPLRRLVYVSAVRPPAAQGFELALRWEYPAADGDEGKLIWEFLGFGPEEEGVFREAAGYYLDAFLNPSWEEWPGPFGKHPGEHRRLVSGSGHPKGRASA